MSHPPTDFDRFYPPFFSKLHLNQKPLLTSSTNNTSHLKRLSQSIIPSNSNSNNSSSSTNRSTNTLQVNHQRTPSPSSPLINHLSNLSLHSNPQPEPRSPSTDQHHCSDSNSTSTGQHASIHPPSMARPTTSNTTSDNLFSEQEPIHLDRPTQSQPPQETLNHITTLALSARITEVAMSIQEVALALFQVQELRHSSAASQSESKRQSSPQTSPSILAADRPSGSALTQVDKALMRLEKKVELTTVEMIELETLIRPYRNQDGSGSAQSRLVNDKFDNILEEWERIQHDTELLKDELKEDKWLVVFRAVGGQAEEMMESLEKVLKVSQEFIRETHRRTRRSSPPLLANSSSLESNLRENRESQASSISSGDRHESEELMKSYNTLIKNFHAKNKHYVPSCERVLGILSKGIKSRSTKNGEVLRRYADMNLRFTNIQETINRVALDLLAVEKILQKACVAPSDSTPANCSLQASEQSSLQPPTDSQIPTTPTSTTSSKTRKALTSMSNYLISTSPQFLSKHSSGISNSISPFRKLASKFASATPSVSSQPSSVCSGPAPLFSIAAVNSTIGTSRPSQQRSLRPIRSTLTFAPSPSSSSISQMASKPGKMTTTTPNHSALEDRRAPSTLPELQRPRTASRQIHHQHTPSHEKPRWNISLKRIEDSPASVSGTSLKKSSSRRMTAQNLSRSQSRAALRNSGTYHSQIGGGINGVAGWERPPSVAGRSEASCGTTLSMSLYRSRPSSRHSRIPAPLWDPSMESQRVQSKGSIDLAELVRPHSRAGPTGNRARPATALSTLTTGLMSPTESDVAKMPGRPPTALGLSSRVEQRLSQGSIPGGALGRIRMSELGSFAESAESEEANPADPLDILIHAKCHAQRPKVVLRRLDSPLSRNPEKARLAGAGIGDQARYAFWFVGLNRPVEEKSVMCKLVEAKRPVSSTTKASSSADPKPELKVLVRTKAGWKDLDLYFLHCQQPPYSSL